jgi:DNA-binding transcriptional MerR regulator
MPDKLYFRIGEVSDIVGVKPYVLRYWESEFSDIHPTKSKSGQRLYKRRDVEMLLLIKQLLYEERFTINGARKRLKEIARGELPSEVAAVAAEEGSVSPRQLEAFPQDDEPAGEVVSRGSSENRKVLMKLKKDLQSLLEELKG